MVAFNKIINSYKERPQNKALSNTSFEPDFNMKSLFSKSFNHNDNQTGSLYHYNKHILQHQQNQHNSSQDKGTTFSRYNTNENDIQSNKIINLTPNKVKISLDKYDFDNYFDKSRPNSHKPPSLTTFGHKHIEITPSENIIIASEFRKQLKFKQDIYKKIYNTQVTSQQISLNDIDEKLYVKNKQLDTVRLKIIESNINNFRPPSVRQVLSKINMDTNTNYNKESNVNIDFLNKVDARADNDLNTISVNQNNNLLIRDFHAIQKAKLKTEIFKELRSFSKDTFKNTDRKPKHKIISTKKVTKNEKSNPVTFDDIRTQKINYDFMLWFPICIFKCVL